MDLLITGASGFLGREVAKQLVHGHRVIAFSRRKTPFGRSCIGDILSGDALEKAMEGIEAVIHLAASSDSDPKMKHRVIVEGTKNVLASAKKAGVKKIVFMSSYAASKKAKDTTAKAKLLAEKMVSSSGMRYTILRPTLIYGEGGRLFESIQRMASWPIIPLLGGGNYLTGPVHVSDVASLAIDSLAKKHDGHLYTIVGDLIPYKELVVKIRSMKRKHGILLPIPISLVFALHSLFHAFRIIPFGRERIQRAVEGIRIDKHDFRPHFPRTLLDLDEGLRRSIRV
ncbi:MAG: NAD(P)-dependent oxidoreductase [Nanoarchaeota archaeon]